jgi:hypothetical protein
VKTQSREALCLPGALDSPGGGKSETHHLNLHLFAFRWGDQQGREAEQSAFVESYGAEPGVSRA